MRCQPAGGSRAAQFQEKGLNEGDIISTQISDVFFLHVYHLHIYFSNYLTLLISFLLQ